MVTKIEFSDRIVYRNELGQYHREDGPAIEFSDGTKYWYIKGQFHREDGPAREFPDGSKFWYLKDIKYSEQEWQQEIINIKLERLKNYGN